MGLCSFHEHCGSTVSKSLRSPVDGFDVEILFKRSCFRKAKLTFSTLLSCCKSGSWRGTWNRSLGKTWRFKDAEKVSERLGLWFTIFYFCYLLDGQMVWFLILCVQFASAWSVGLQDTILFKWRHLIIRCSWSRFCPLHFWIVQSIADPNLKIEKAC